MVASLGPPKPTPQLPLSLASLAMVFYYFPSNLHVSAASRLIASKCQADRNVGGLIPSAKTPVMELSSEATGREDLCGLGDL